MMPNFEDVRHLLDKIYPHGSKREIWWVTQESLDNNSCNQCGRCCAMFGLTFSLEVFREAFCDPDKEDEGNPDIGFLIKHMAQIPTKEADARGGDGGGENFVCCSLLTLDGRCSRYEDRPHFCRRHPILGQSVVSECAFAGIDDYEKSPRGLEAARLSKLPAEKVTLDRELEP
jgi:Fe-S-cluster containining protein